MQVGTSSVYLDQVRILRS